MIHVGFAQQPNGEYIALWRRDREISQPILVTRFKWQNHAFYVALAYAKGIIAAGGKAETAVYDWSA